LKSISEFSQRKIEDTKLISRLIVAHSGTDSVCKPQTHSSFAFCLV